MSDTKSEGFKWFGEGFDGFPKRLPEDCIEYAIYVIDNHGGANKIKKKTRLRQVEQEAIGLSRSLLKDYIWQREAFSLNLNHEDGNLCLHGRTNFGDSVADEWTIVYILRKLSTDFPDIWIRLYDNDGEFLLIEAANALPKWLNPEVAENRVWMNSGKLLIIPISLANGSSKTRKGPLSLQDAQSFLVSRSSELLHSSAIEDEAFHRIKAYPGAMHGIFHNALIRIPRKLAYVIREIASSISPAIEAFYLRDPISLKQLQKEQASELYFPPTDFVTMSVKFTKVGYAQIRSQEFSPPVAWATKCNETGKETGLQQEGQVETGIKITCAYEMLLADNQFQDNKNVREIKLLLEDLETGEEATPSNEVIDKWCQGQDDEKWLNIDFNAFDRELSGQAKNGHDKSGFGDEAAQESLRKIVERFEAFLKDDSAGVEGVEDIDDMDFDDDEDIDEQSDESSDRSDSANNLDNSESKRTASSKIQQSKALQGSRIQELNSDDEELQDEEDEEDIIREMQQMEEELRAHGMLELNPIPENLTAIGATSKKLESGESEKVSGSTSDNNDRIKLAEQLLESFKAQAGAAGPAGNLMGMLGTQLPRDEELPEN